MTLIDPREALAEQSNFIGYLMGLVGLARVVHALAAEGEQRPDRPSEADDFVHVLLGIASLGEDVERLAESAPAQRHWVSTAPSPASTNMRWLR